MAAARRVPEVGEEALADLVVGILHENNCNMCACRAGQNLYNLDPAYKPLLKRIGGIKGLCSRHSERLQYVGNAGGGVVCLGSGKILVSPRQQIREEHEAPLLPAIIEGGAGLAPEVDRPSGATTDAPAVNQNIGAASQPSSSGANSAQNLGDAIADANGEQQEQQAQKHQISSDANALAPLPPPTVGDQQPPKYRTWRNSQHTGETNTQKRARYLLLFPEASEHLKDAAVEVAAQLEGSAVHKQMLQSLELAGTVGLTTRQLMDEHTDISK
jgi:hypothetical protein